MKVVSELCLGLAKITILLMLSYCAVAVEMCAPDDVGEIPSNLVIERVLSTNECGTKNGDIKRKLILSEPYPKMTVCSNYERISVYGGEYSKIPIIKTFYPDLPTGYVVTERLHSEDCDGKGENAVVIDIPEDGMEICRSYSVSSYTDVKVPLPENYVVTKISNSRNCNNSKEGALTINKARAGIEMCAPRAGADLPEGFVISSVRRDSFSCGGIGKKLKLQLPEDGATICDAYQLVGSSGAIWTNYANFPKGFVVTERRRELYCDGKGLNALVIKRPVDGMEICSSYNPNTFVNLFPEIPKGFVVTETQSSFKCGSMEDGTLTINKVFSGVEMCAGYNVYQYQVNPHINSTSLYGVREQKVPAGYVATSIEHNFRCAQNSAVVIELPKDGMDICLSYRFGKSRVKSKNLPFGYVIDDIGSSIECGNIDQNQATIYSIFWDQNPRPGSGQNIYCYIFGGFFDC